MAKPKKSKEATEAKAALGTLVTHQGERKAEPKAQEIVPVPPYYRMPLAVLTMAQVSPLHPTVQNYVHRESKQGYGSRSISRHEWMDTFSPSFGMPNPPHEPEHVRRGCIRVFSERTELRRGQFGISPTYLRYTYKPRSRRGWENGGKAHRKLQAQRTEQALKEQAAKAKAERMEHSRLYNQWLASEGYEHTARTLAVFNGLRRDWAGEMAAIDARNKMCGPQDAKPMLTWADWLAAQKAAEQKEAA